MNENIINIIGIGVTAFGTCVLGNLSRKGFYNAAEKKCASIVASNSDMTPEEISTVVAAEKKKANIASNVVTVLGGAAIGAGVGIAIDQFGCCGGDTSESSDTSTTEDATTTDDSAAASESAFF